MAKNKTYADIAEKLNRKEQKYQGIFDNARTTRERNSAELMLERIAERREALIQANSEAAAPKGEAPVESFAYGGYNGPGDPIESITKAMEKLTSSKFNYSMDPAFVREQYGINPMKFADPNFMGGKLKISGNKSDVGGTKAVSASPREKVQNVTGYAHGFTPEIAKMMEIGHGVTDKEMSGNIKSSIADIDKNLDNKDPNKKTSPLDKIIGAVGMTAPFMDNFAFGKYVNEMKGPALPDLMSSPIVNTKVNVNPQLADAKRANRILNRSLDRSSTSRGTANNNKISAFVQRMNNTGRVLTDKENKEARLRNMASRLGMQTDRVNTSIRNKFNQDNVDFSNEKAYQKYLNKVNISEDIGNINSQRLKRKEQEAMLEVLKPYYDMFGNMSKYASQYS